MRVMFSDTHFHFSLLVNHYGIDGAELLTDLTSRSPLFMQDIGTGCDDLSSRLSLVSATLEKLDDTTRKLVEPFLFFSAGIWPAPDAIRDRDNQIAILEQQIVSARNAPVPLHRKITSLGECGLDHHWNPSGVDGRAESDFDHTMIAAEEALFEMQLTLARRLELPVIVHSRDAFDQTLGCIINSGYDTGIIHCYSYGIEEARKFLDRGWYISFAGGITYTKKSRLQEMNELLRFIPDDRLLLETDSPYLAPVPLRGQVNTPCTIEHTYRFVAAARGCTPEAVSALVDTNAAELFKLQMPSNSL
jgi:TatD DNase family protein